MAAVTAIAWTNSTFNAWWGCTKVGPGCDNCYAHAMDRRFGGEHWGPGAPRRTFKEEHWNEPRRWNAKAAAEGRRHLVFCSSMADVFDNEAPEGQRDRLWALVRETPALTWQIVTKRIGNAPKMFPADWAAGYPNVWIIATVVNQAEMDRDGRKLAQVPAKIRGLSMEPLLGPVDIRPWLADGTVNWVITGGESGRRARHMDPAWVLALRDQCAEFGTPYFFKQWGGIHSNKGGCELAGGEHKEWPLAA